MSHSKKASIFNKDIERTTWHDETLWFVRQKRDKMAYVIPEFQQLRDLASQIKEHTLSQLDEYLLEFERNALKNGVHVHWAADAKEHNEIVLKILKKHKAKKIVKSKSMLTEECHLNPFLQQHAIKVVDTDLGERIIQLRDEAPSHIVLPAIHLKKEDVGETFHQHLNTPKGEKDPQRLTEAARQHLREKFVQADAALTGVNFAIAETGSVVVCTNEGNADLGVNLAKVHIACMGFEKIIPRFNDLSVFTRLLARSATGQPITTYTSHFTKPRPGAEMHVVIVDNGRTQQLGREDFYNSLKCIRCGACMNTCPVYRRSGGHSYNFTVPGPIGSILSPNLDLKKHSSLPFASTLCGSCTEVCPVKIDIHVQLYKWRQQIGESNALPMSKKLSMKVMSKVLASSKLFSFSGKMGRTMIKWLPYSMTHNKSVNPWAKARELPEVPEHSFREWYKQNK
ncbi:LutB/LldF family L-lactate oxidation iron-sulfur protein [Solitalea koreensis]|uniref:L-lactate dehydrogenase complex protein LldF n=1 Tax=Solitalea koreensis TaxID=543615 RepID=A0A521BID9_9SPHI|nr:LutB/LldF family L-lactate oxidation iron-sulfur protein [Solitalea koreensis]SMO46894.1 L-lactate dehydrogenase complex protein LldF [Solitalea koreensis]